MSPHQTFWFKAGGWVKFVIYSEWYSQYFRLFMPIKSRSCQSSSKCLNIHIKLVSVILLISSGWAKLYTNFRSRRWGSSLPGLRTRDPLLSPPSTWAEIFRHTCLQSHLPTSPPTPQKSYPKFRNPRTIFEIFNLGGLISPFLWE